MAACWFVWILAECHESGDALDSVLRIVKAKATKNESWQSGHVIFAVNFFEAACDDIWKLLATALPVGLAYHVWRLRQ